MVTVGRMTEEDIVQLARLETVCFGALAWTEQGLRDELTNETAHFFVIKEDGVIAGYIGTFVVCESCYVSNIAVFPEMRRKGYAARLISAAADNARSLGAQSVSLEVRPSNSAALSLYASAGFEEIGLRKGFYREPKEDALILSLSL